MAAAARIRGWWQQRLGLKADRGRARDAALPCGGAVDAAYRCGDGLARATGNISHGRP